MITILCARGIGESMRENMLSNVTKHLDPARFRAREAPWEATYGPVPQWLGTSFNRTLATSHALLLKMISEDPYPVILLGYSGGAALAGNVAAEYGRGHLPSLDIRGVGLISDPLRSTDWTDNTWGIAGARHIGGWAPVWHMVDPSDVITRCPANSPLRTIADQSAAFSLVDPAAWSWDMVQRLRQQRWQSTIRDWRNVYEVRKAYSEAITGAEGYLFGGAHTNYHTRIYRDGMTYTEWLAARINEIKE